MSRDPQSVFERNPKSRKAAVDAFCWECQGGNADPAPYWRIGNCESLSCQLWTFRPFRHHYGTEIPAVLRENDGLQGNRGDLEGVA